MSSSDYSPIDVLYDDIYENEYSESELRNKTSSLNSLSLKEGTIDRWKTKRKLFLFICGFIVFLIPLTSAIYVPTMPVIVGKGVTTQTYIVLSLCSFTLFTGLMPLFYGPLLDRFGRKKFLFSTLLAFVGANIMAGSSIEGITLTISRGFQAITNGGFMIAATSVIADVYPPNQRGTAIGIVMVPAMIGPAIGPAIGGFLSQYVSWRSTFYLLALLSLIVWALVTFKLPETHPRIITEEKYFNKLQQNFENAKNMGELFTETSELLDSMDNEFEELKLNFKDPPPFNPLNTLKIILHWPIAFCCITNGFTFALMFVVINLWPQIIENNFPDVSSFESGLLITVYGAGAIVGSLVGGKAADKLKIKYGKGAMLSCSLISSIGISVSTFIFSIFVEDMITIPTILSFFIGFFGMSNRNSTVSFLLSMFPPEKSGAATATLLLTQFSVVVVELIFISILNSLYSPLVGFGTFSIINMLVLPFCIYTMIKKWKE
eukprot:TRINITY_DN1141_c0_g1_i2.p1 TRINITY_DN1141_c0_g1~~TRINITY_DN1141_c0_g1_i2.p1  ORF type:complete len:490 (-),score=120.82 TRINITY_DN1141_c0_g1_i2:38-1507(-)